MKFEQAFYTAGENQLSQYKEGLGICASSNKDADFIEQCRKQGSKFVPEPGETRAEFVFYSDIFRNFVGVGIGPGKSGNYNRSNMLCHMFVPVQGDKVLEPSEYLVEYPFLTEVEDNAWLETQELESVSFDTYEILKQYGLDRIGKMAKLLDMVYSCVFLEKIPLYIVTGEYGGMFEEDRRIAREIIWLLAHFLPVQEGAPSYFLNRLSFGVHTTKNASQAAVIFMNKSEENRYEFWLDQEDETDKTLEVYQRMAEYAISSVKSGQEFTFVKEVFECGEGEKKSYYKLPLFYLRWKLDHGEKVSCKEMESERRNVVYQAKEDGWYRRFLLDYLIQMDENEVANLETYFNAIMRILQNGILAREEEEKIGDVVACLLQKICQESNQAYEKALGNLEQFSNDMRKGVLDKLYRQSDSCVKEEEGKISDVSALEKYWEKYRILSKKETFCTGLRRKAIQLYQEADRKERNRISKIMKQLVPGEWEYYILQERIEHYVDVSGYITFLKDEYEKMELCCASSYCNHMLELAGKKILEREKEEVRNVYYKILENVGRQWIEKYVENGFESLFHIWEHDKIEEKKLRFLKEAETLTDVENYFVFAEATDSDDTSERIDIHEKCQRYRILAEEYPGFVKIVRENVSNNLSGRAKKEFEGLHCFLCMMNYDISENCLSDAAKLLCDAQELFGDAEPEYQKLLRELTERLQDIKRKYEKKVEAVRCNNSASARKEALELASRYNQVSRAFVAEGPLLKYVIKSSEDFKGFY